MIIYLFQNLHETKVSENRICRFHTWKLTIKGTLRSMDKIISLWKYQTWNHSDDLNCNNQNDGNFQRSLIMLYEDCRINITKRKTATKTLQTTNTNRSYLSKGTKHQKDISTFNQSKDSWALQLNCPPISLLGSREINHLVIKCYWAQWNP